MFFCDLEANFWVSAQQPEIGHTQRIIGRNIHLKISSLLSGLSLECLFKRGFWTLMYIWDWLFANSQCFFEGILVVKNKFHHILFLESHTAGAPWNPKHREKGYSDSESYKLPSNNYCPVFCPKHLKGNLVTTVRI